MARSRSGMWTVIISVVVGVVGASLFWHYGPYGHDRPAQPAAEDLQTQTHPEEGKGGSVSLKKLPSQATGSRYQMVADGKQVFLVDLKNGRVWRYFHQTKEAVRLHHEDKEQDDEGSDIFHSPADHLV